MMSNRALNAPDVCFYYLNSVLKPESWQDKNLSYNTCKINLFVRGEFTIYSGNESISPVWGDLCVLFPHEVHYGVIETENVAEYFEFLIDPRAFEMIDGGEKLLTCVMNRNANIGNFCRPPAELSEKMIETCYRVLSALNSENPSRFALAYAELLYFLSDLNKAYESGTAPKSNPVPALCRAVMSFINEHYTQIPTIEAIARQFAVSTSHLIRTFRSVYGCTPYQYIIKLKVTRAAELLLSGANVTEACYAVGFSDCSRFIQTFKSHMGKTPTQYKKEQ